MSDQELRERIARAIFDARAEYYPADQRWDGDWLRPDEREGYRRWADAVIAVLPAPNPCPYCLRPLSESGHEECAANAEADRAARRLTKDALPALSHWSQTHGDDAPATIVRALALYDGAEGRLPELARTMDHDRAVLGDLLAALKGQGR